MKIAVASGKGGTGKTLVATSLAVSICEQEAVTFLDCDVEEPDAALLLKPEITCRQGVTIPVPVIDEEACTRCGRCAEVCAFHAIAVLGDHVLTFPELCHGCGACTYFCPERAITEQGRACGVIECGMAHDMEFVNGRLTVGEAMAPPVIRAVKARPHHGESVIIDAPPGTSCPVVESIRGTDFCLLVTEPTPFGLNDLQLAVSLVRLMGLPAGVIINRAGWNDDIIGDYCAEEDLPVLATIPLDREIARLYSEGTTLAATVDGWKRRFRDVFSDIKDLVE